MSGHIWLEGHLHHLSIWCNLGKGSVEFDVEGFFVEHVFKTSFMDAVCVMIAIMWRLFRWRTQLKQWGKIAKMESFEGSFPWAIFGWWLETNMSISFPTLFFGSFLGKIRPWIFPCSLFFSLTDVANKDFPLSFFSGIPVVSLSSGWVCYMDADRQWHTHRISTLIAVATADPFF